MRIIDSNKDFYDYYQNIYRDDSLTFDRRDSYDLSKEEFAGNFYYDSCHTSYRYYNKWYSKHHDVLLQICNTFWLFDLEVIKTNEIGRCVDYTLNLSGTWKDYNKPRELMRLSNITFWYYKVDTLEKKINAIKTNDYRVQKVFDKFHVYKSNGVTDVREERHTPILKNIGIAGCVDPMDIYLALEEYFSLEKTATERTESAGLTNDEKVSNHGFDLKKSFRGK